MKVKVKSLSRVQLPVTLWTVVYQAPLSMGFSRQGFWSGLPFPSSGDLPDPGIKPGSPALQANALPSEPPGNPVAEHKLSHLSTLAQQAFRTVSLSSLSKVAMDDRFLPDFFPEGQNLRN